MTPQIPEIIATWFQNYVNMYINKKTPFIDLLQQRVDHSMQVADYCGDLAEELRWSEENTMLGMILGLLHDIGRFSQIDEYGTLIDSDSINHGERGYEVIIHELFLKSLSTRHCHILLNGIRYHNRKKFHQKVPTETLPFLKLVRDAEKMDRYRIISETVNSNHNRQSFSSLFNLTIPNPVNPFIIDEIAKGKAVSRKHIQSPTDLHLVELSWVFDIYYQPTLKRVYESQIIEKIIWTLPKESTIQAASESVLAYLKAHTL